MSNATTAPIETKVAAAGATSAATGVVTWVLVTYVFHRALPPELASFLPYLVAAVLGPVAGYWAKHTPRLEEIAAEVAQVVGGYVPLQAGNLAVPPAPVAEQPASQ